MLDAASLYMYIYINPFSAPSSGPREMNGRDCNSASVSLKLFIRNIQRLASSHNLLPAYFHFQSPRGHGVGGRRGGRRGERERDDARICNLKTEYRRS